MEAVIAYIQKGGVFMYPIIAGAVWALTLMLERMLFYLQTSWNMSKNIDTTFALLQKGDFEAAEAFLRPRHGLNDAALYVGITNRHRPVERIEDKINQELLRRLPAYGRNLSLIAVLAGVMPILGLLGTVTGMIATFKVIEYSGTGDIQAMAGGISIALITTQAGLVSALPIILGHIFLSTRLKKITDMTRAANARFIDLIKERQHDK